MKKVIWTPSAARDLRSIHDSYSALATKTVANRILSNIIKRTDELANYPLLGRKRDDLSHGTREYRILVTGKHKVVYWISGDNVFVAACFDSRKDPDSLLSRLQS